MADADASLYECPVCTNFFECPKLFPCYHLVCRNCILPWLRKNGGRGECPICRAPILSSTPQDQGQLEAQVDCLPTDRATQVLAESHKILSDPDECQLCPNNVAGQNFCLQCSFKLCTQCTISHQKIPATSLHTLEKLSKLTVKTLAARHQVKCKTHKHQVVELYCPSHGELICCRCGATTHRGCPEIKEIEDVAKGERQKFKDQLVRMKLKERKMAKKIKDAKEKVKAKTKNVNDAFDDFIQCIESRRHGVNILLQAQGDKVMASLAEVEQAQVSLALPLRSLENLVGESPDDGLIETLQQLASRLDDLESQMEFKADVGDVGCLILDDQFINRLKLVLANLVRLQQPQSRPTSTPAAGATPTTSAIVSDQTRAPDSQPTSTPEERAIPPTSATNSGPTTAPKPEGAALARVLKVGDRVKLAPSAFDWGAVQPGETGTVTTIPSRVATALGQDPQGLVDVRWDRTGEYCHYMGRDDKYRLILA